MHVTSLLRRIDVALAPVVPRSSGREVRANSRARDVFAAVKNCTTFPGRASGFGVLALGAALALGGCGQQSPGDAGIQAAGITVPTPKALGHADNTALAKQFDLAGPAESESLLDNAERRAENITTKGKVRGREFAEDELVSMRDVAAALQPLWQCKNARHFKLARVDYLIDGGAMSENVAGVAFSSLSLIALADSSRKEGHMYGTVGVFVHELGHAFITYANPLTCQNFDDANDNPLFRKYVDIMKKHEPAPVTEYGGTSMVEDMAEGLRLYMTQRDDLRRMRPYRAKFFDDLFAELKVAPPPELDEYNGPAIAGAARKPRVETVRNWARDNLWQLDITRDGVPVHITMKMNGTLTITRASKM